MANRNARRGRLIYTVCLDLWAFLLILAAFFALSRLWKYAAAYEASRPEAAMRSYVSGLG